MKQRCIQRYMLACVDNLLQQQQQEAVHVQLDPAVTAYSLCSVAVHVPQIFKSIISANSVKLHGVEL